MFIKEVWIKKSLSDFIPRLARKQTKPKTIKSNLCIQLFDVVTFHKRKQLTNRRWLIKWLYQFIYNL